MKFHLAMPKDILKSAIDFARRVEASRRDDEIIAARRPQGREASKQIRFARFPEVVQPTCVMNPVTKEFHEL